VTVSKKAIAGIVGGIVIATVIAYFSLSHTDTSDSVSIIFQGHVTDVIDGDTIEVEHIRIRLSLTSTPELNEKGGVEAKEFTANLCPLGSSARVVVDGGQLEDQFGRTVAKVYCDEILLNSELLERGLASIDKRFCSTSEFASEDWAKRYGCTQTVQTKENKQTSSMDFR